MEVKKITEGMTASQVAEVIDSNFRGIEEETAAKFSELTQELNDVQIIVSEGKKSVYIKKASVTYSIPITIKKGSNYSIKIIADNVLSSTEYSPFYVNSTSGNRRNIVNGSSFTATANEDINQFIIYVREASFIGSGNITLVIKNNYIDQRFDSIDQRFDSTDQRFDSIDKEINDIKVNRFVGSFIGKDNQYVSTEHTSLKPLNKYRIYLNRTSWNTPSINEGLLLFGVESFDENGNMKRLATCYVGSQILDYYDIEVPFNSKSVRVGGRASVGEKITYTIVEFSEVRTLMEKVSDINTILSEGEKSNYIYSSGETYEYPVNIKAGTEFSVELIADNVLSNTESCVLYLNSTSGYYKNIANRSTATFTPTDDVTSLIMFVREVAFLGSGRAVLKIKNNYISKRIEKIEDNISVNSNILNSLSSSLGVLVLKNEVSSVSTTYSFPCSLEPGKEYTIKVFADGVLTDEPNIPLYYNGTSKLIGNIGNGQIIKFIPSVEVADFTIYTKIDGFIAPGKVLLLVSDIDIIKELDSLNIGEISEITKNVKADKQEITLILKQQPYRIAEIYVEDKDNTIVENGVVLLYKIVNGQNISLGSIRVNEAREYIWEESVDGYFVYVQQSQMSDMSVASSLTLRVKLLSAFETSYRTLNTDALIKNTFTSSYNETNIEAKAREYAELYKGTIGEVEPFVYFTDAHIMTDAISDIEMKKSMSLVEKFYNSIAANFVLCGGDWYNADIQSDALYKLSYIDGYLKKLFKLYYPVFGNHDNNYQGKLNSESEVRTGTISEQTMINLMYRQWGRKYYSFSGTSTNFYVLDSGIDWNTAMDGCRWEQVDWLAKELIEKDGSHNVVTMHIVCNSGHAETWDENTTPFADNITLIMNAYNNKASISLNEKTYDFSNTKGVCHCVLCGHTHYDHIATRNNIPVFCTTQFKLNYTGTTTFDLILLDYGSNKLKSVRVGVGDNREMELARNPSK